MPEDDATRYLPRFVLMTISTRRFGCCSSMLRSPGTSSLSGPNPSGFNPARLDPKVDHEPCFHGIGAALRKHQVIFARPDRIRVAFDAEDRFRIAPDQLAEFLHFIQRVGAQLRAIVIERAHRPGARCYRPRAMDRSARAPHRATVFPGCLHCHRRHLRRASYLECAPPAGLAPARYP